MSMAEIKALTVIWEVAASIGLLTQFLLLWDEARSLEALRSRGLNGSARLVSWSDIRTDAFGAMVMGILLAVGIVIHLNVFRGAPPYNFAESWAAEHVSVVLRYGLISSIVLLVIKGLWLRHDRHRLLRMMEESH